MKKHKLNLYLSLAVIFSSIGSLAQDQPPISPTPQQQEPIELIRIKAEKGDPQAQFQIGLQMTNNADALPWFLKAAEQNHVKAQYLVASAYENGSGTKTNIAEAIKWYRKAADADDPDAQITLAKYCLRETEGPQNNASAFFWYLKAAQHDFGISPAPADMTMDGSREMLFRWINHGRFQAALMLGNCYYYGRGTTKDYESAVKFYTRAAGADFTLAETQLYACFKTGTGVGKDPVLAIQWALKAANNDHIPSQAIVGSAYLTGTGVERDIVEAYAWLNIAARNPGRNEEAEERDALEPRMTSHQIAEAQRLSRRRTTEIDEKMKFAGTELFP
jgi:TPR repeat protein